MCVILELKRGVMPLYEKFANAVWNNPDGYGIIMKANGRMDVEKKLVPHEKTDPEAIYKILYDNKEAERIVHLRWKTAGDLSEDNLHPFLVHEVGKQQTWFAHNGTFGKYSGSTYVQGVRIEQKESDTFRFVNEVLKPLFNNFRMENGRVELDNPFLLEIINKFWDGNSRGILVNTSQESQLIGSWDKLKGVDDAEFLASNNTYFDKLTRGPEYEKRKREEAAQNTAFNSNKRTSQLADILPLDCSRFNVTYGLAKQLEYMWSDKEIYTLKGLAACSALSRDEFELLQKDDPEGTTTLLLLMSKYLREADLAIETLKREASKNVISH